MWTAFLVPATQYADVSAPEVRFTPKSGLHAATQWVSASSQKRKFEQALCQVPSAPKLTSGYAYDKVTKTLSLGGNGDWQELEPLRAIWESPD